MLQKSSKKINDHVEFSHSLMQLFNHSLFPRFMHAIIQFGSFNYCKLMHTQPKVVNVVFTPQWFIDILIKLNETLWSQFPSISTQLVNVFIPKMH